VLHFLAVALMELQRMRPNRACNSQRSGAVLRAALGLALSAAVLFTFAPNKNGEAFAVVGKGAALVDGLLMRQPMRASAVSMRVSPYYSNAYRERLARRRKEMRLIRKDQAQTKGEEHLNFDLLPPIEDIYSRRYSGNVTSDPIGGRKRYTFYLLFKSNQKLEAQLNRYRSFFKYKMSCRNIEINAKRGSDGFADEKLEYPMKQYGELKVGIKERPQSQRAYIVTIDMMAPVQAVEYITKKFYSDESLLRVMVLGHTRTFKHLGEDNELFL